MIELTIQDSSGTELKREQYDRDQISIGRVAANDLVLASPKVSSKHASLKLEKDSWTVEDHESTNGTFLNGKPVQGAVELKNGDEIIVGEFRIRVGLESDEDSTLVRQRKEKESDATLIRKHGSKAKAAKAKAAAASADPIREFKQAVHKKLIEFLDLRWVDLSKLPEAELQNQTRTAIDAILRELAWQVPQGLNREELIKQIMDEALGLGSLEDLLADPEVSEIMVNRFDRIYIERKGKLQLSDKKFTSNQAVLAAIERIVAPIGRRIDESSPMVDARLKDGSRVNAIIPPLALKGPALTIRKFNKSPLTADDLVKFGAMTRGMANFLKLCVELRQNLIVSGGTGSGKTTLLNMLSGFIPGDERIVTAEDSAELKLMQDHVVSLETRPPNLEGTGAVTIRDLVRNSLRMRPDRIVVGECRAGEALDMLQAMNTGHDGSMTTLHANAPRDAIARLEVLVLMAGMDLPVRAIREQIASAVNIIIQQTRFSDGTRKVTYVSEVTGLEDEHIQIQDVFYFKQEGFTPEGKVAGRHVPTGYIPRFYESLRQRGLQADLSIFRGEEAA